MANHEAIADRAAHELVVVEGDGGVDEGLILDAHPGLLFFFEGAVGQLYDPPGNRIRLTVSYRAATGAASQ